MGYSGSLLCGTREVSFPNEVGGEIWKLLPEVKDEEELIARLLDIYEVEEEELRKDVAEFLDSMRKIGIL